MLAFHPVVKENKKRLSGPFTACCECLIMF